MVTIGIVGGIASGKSAVAAQFASLGAVLIDADKVGHEVLSDPEVVAAARHRWGEEVANQHGAIIRSAVAERIFGVSQKGESGQSELDFWNSVTHPRIAEIMLHRIAQLRQASPPVKGVILDAALMFEAGWDQACDAVIFLDVPRAVRIERALARGWTAEQFAQREAAQIAVEEKRRKADYVIDNSQSLDETYRRVKQLWMRLSK